jgi:hypothetical protein
MAETKTGPDANCRVMWMAVFEAATRDDRPQLAQRARRELMKLGVIIQGLPPLPEEAAPCRK